MADAQNGKGFSQLTSVIGNINSVANSSRRGPREAVDIGRNWKPVNFGEYQGLGEILPMQASTVGPASSPPSSKQQTGTDISVSPPLATAAVDKLMKDGNESDSDVRRVPELSAKTSGGVSGSHTQDKGLTGSSHRKRGGASADKEHKRLKRCCLGTVFQLSKPENEKKHISVNWKLDQRSWSIEMQN
uniref:Uncharacterized protein n=1 Tax=Physcomitrium patens TaxID=3218 RepID=A0A7I4A7L5_PHYPA